MANESRIYEQIEKEAGFYQPAVYELLTFYQSLENQQEPLDGQFVPMTTVQARSPQQTKIFAIGLIPPSSSVTGRLLDRSASIQALLGSVEVSAQEAEAQEIEDVRRVGNQTKGVIQASPALQRKSAAKLAGLHASIQPLAQQLVEAAAREGIIITITQGHRSTAEQDALYAKGRTVPGSVVTGVQGGESWHNFGLAFDVAIVAPPPPGKATTAPGRDEWAIVGALGTNLGLTWGGSFSNLNDPGHFEYHPGLTKAEAQAGSRPTVPEEDLSIQDSANPSTGWVASGSANANQASKTASQVAKRDMLREGLGERFQKGQQAMINMMTAALNRMANTPPLRLLVNPQSFKVSAEKLISDGNWGRSGPIIEHWGENQDKIEGSGKIAGFYSVDAQNANGPGLNRTARQFSTSYQNLLALWLIYKNNGGVSFPDPIVPKGSRAQNLAVVGSVYLYYDDILYIGSFDTFTLTEAADTPFTLEYSFAFTVRSWYVLDHQDDPQYMYGRPGTPPTPNNPVRKLTPYLVGLPISGSGSPTNNPQPSPEVALPADGLTSTLDDLFDRFALAELEEGG